MPSVSRIHFTQDQVRTLTGVSPEAVRHWRKAVPYLSAKTGKAARFSFADVIGLAATVEIVHSLGVHIGTLSGGIDALFRLLSRIGPAGFKSGTILVTQTDAQLYSAERRSVTLPATAVIVSLEPLAARIQEQMMPTPMGPASATQPVVQELRRKA
jgi:hypothetical protein